MLVAILAVIAAGWWLWPAGRPLRRADRLRLAFASDRANSGDLFALDSAGRLVNLTRHPAADWEPAWRPDGQMLAFTSHRSGNSDIWLLDLAGWSPGEDGPPPERLVNLTHHPAWDYSPAWSPDGQSIVFVSERDGDPEIFIQNINEPDAVQLTFNRETDQFPTWSPDGRYIAFAAVRGGAAEIYRIRPDGTGEARLTPPGRQGSYPAWSPDGQRLAFVSWDEEHRAGIYVLAADRSVGEPRFTASAWLGNLHWSADGSWLTFTGWQDGSHEVYALPADGTGPPVRLSAHPAWDDGLVLNPAYPFQPDPLPPAAPAPPASPAAGGLAAGVNLADLSSAYLVNDLGAGWAKGYVNWATVEPEPGQFRWVDPDNVVKAFGDRGLHILLRVHGTPAWARPEGTPLSFPPTDPDAFARFLTRLAARYRGRVAAYEIWNEPNLNYEWGNQRPDPAAYAGLLKTAYTAIKQVDPQAVVVSGGLATTGGGSDTAYGDLDFLHGMYQAGVRGYFDALGSHPYAYGLPPDTSHPDGLSFDRVLAQRQVMLAYGDDSPIWITEVGWVLQSHWDLGEHAAIGVSEAQQAEYLVRAYQKAGSEWPFVQAFFIFNLDFSLAPWYLSAEPMRWYAILNPNRTPRPAYTSLRQILHHNEQGN